MLGIERYDHLSVAKKSPDEHHYDAGEIMFALILHASTISFSRALVRSRVQR